MGILISFCSKLVRNTHPYLQVQRVEAIELEVPECLLQEHSLETTSEWLSSVADDSTSLHTEYSAKC